MRIIIISNVIFHKFLQLNEAAQRPLQNTFLATRFIQLSRCTVQSPHQLPFYRLLSDPTGKLSQRPWQLTPPTVKALPRLAGTPLTPLRFRTR